MNDRPTLTTARTGSEVCEAVARWCWWESHQTECPPSHIPTLPALTAWLATSDRCVNAIAQEQSALLRACLHGRYPHMRDAWRWTIGGRQPDTAADDDLVACCIVPSLDDADALGIPPTIAPADTSIQPHTLRSVTSGGWEPIPLLRVHALWVTTPQPRSHHPLAPLVGAWQRRTTKRTPYVPTKRASLPRLSKISEDDVTLPTFIDDSNPPSPGEQLMLPGFGDVITVCPSWLLWLFDRAGGSALPAGRGARWDLRLFVYALLHMRISDRDGLWHTYLYPTEQVIDWLHPRGWANRRRDWNKLPEALHAMRERLSYVPVPGIGYVATLIPSVIPSTPTDPLIEFTIRVPSVAAHGDRIDWPRLVAYGATSDRLFRAYLAVTAWMGRSSNRGHPITREIAPPVIADDGKPKRRKGKLVVGSDGKQRHLPGAIVRSKTDLVPNPAARYAGPILFEPDLTRMIALDPTNRYHRRDARAAFERMHADGVIDLQRSDGGFLIFGPRVN